MKKSAKNSTLDEYLKNCVFKDNYNPDICRRCFLMFGECITKKEWLKAHKYD